MPLQKLRARYRPPQVDANRAVARPIVQQRLAQASRTPLTLLIAPPGFGKTTALGVWLREEPEHVVFVSVGPRDGDFAGFTALILGACQLAAPDVGDVLVADVKAEADLDGYVLAELVAEALERAPHDVTLVIDDYHEIRSFDAHAFFGELVRIGLPSLHLVISSRYDPPFPWARLRLDGRLTEVRSPDLKLSLEQTAQVLARVGLPEPDDHVLARMIFEQTQGWPAGITGASLALTAMPETTDKNAISEGIYHSISEFLVQEVFERQPAMIQQALMRLALLERFDAGLAEALTETGSPERFESKMLAELLASSPYLDHDLRSGLFAFHPLFRRFLLQQFATYYDTAGQQAVQRQAGAALARRGHFDEAIALLAGAGNVEDAADIIREQMNILLLKQDWRPLEHWLSLLPDAVVQECPWLIVGRVWVSHLTGRDSLLSAYTKRLRHLAARAGTDADELLSICEVMSAVRDTETERAASSLQRALLAISPQNGFAGGLAHFYLGLRLQRLGRVSEAIKDLAEWTQVHSESIDARYTFGLQGQMFVHHAEGNLIAAQETGLELSALAHAHDLPIAAGWADRELGIVAYLQNRLDDAERHFLDAVSNDHRGNIACGADALAGLACTYWENGRQQEALTTLAQVNDLIRMRQVAEHMAWARALAAKLALRESPPDVFRALGLTDNVDPDMGYLIQFAFPPKIRIFALLHSGTPEHLDEAEKRLAALELRAERERNIPMQIAASALCAALYDQRGRRAEALAVLGAAIRRAAPDRVLRPFMDIAPLLRPLLLELTERRDEIEGMAELADALGPEFRVELPSGISPSLELLTIREAEVFELLMERMTYKEIAYQLSIAPDTVKRHVNNIYTKLGVSGRRDALLRAGELGWHGA